MFNTAQAGGKIDGSTRSDRTSWLESEHARVTERLERLEEAMGELRRAPYLRADAAAVLAKYGQSHAHLQYERMTLEWEIHELSKPPDSDGKVSTLPDELLNRARKNRKRSGRLPS